MKPKETQQKLLGSRTFENVGPSPGGGLPLRVCVLTLPFSLELGVGLGGAGRVESWAGQKSESP